MDGTRKTILFFTNSEYGQANVMLAVAHEFLIRDEFNIHVATFADAGPRVSLFNQNFATRHATRHSDMNEGLQNSPKTEAASKAEDTVPMLTFHPVAGRSMAEALVSNPDYYLGHGVNNIGAALKSYKTLVEVVFYWTPDEYLEAFKSCTEIIKTVQPSFIVCDPIFYVGQDAVNNSKVPYAVLSPTCFKDTVLAIQPLAGGLWRYPAFVLFLSNALLLKLI